VTENSSEAVASPAWLRAEVVYPPEVAAALEEANRKLVVILDSLKQGVSAVVVARDAFWNAAPSEVDDWPVLAGEWFPAARRFFGHLAEVSDLVAWIEGEDFIAVIEEGGSDVV
jgi:hypothetical protein